MTLKEYIENLNKFVKENPETLDYQVIYSRDDEGNGYQQVHSLPDIGQFDGDDFSSKDNYDEEPEEYGDDFEVNAVCIN